MSIARNFFFVAFMLTLVGETMFAGGSRQEATKSGQSTTLSGEARFSWWGNEARNKATGDAINAYMANHPGTKVVAEPAGFEGYYNKLVAQLAASNAPDLFTMTGEWMPTLVDLGGCEDITGKIDISAFNPRIVEACSVGGRMYGVNLGNGANVIYYNKTQAEELGIKMPAGDYTWDDLVKICQEIYQKSGGKTYGMVDLRMVAANETNIAAWNMTHMGKEPPFPWTDKEMIITGADVAAFMAYFQKMPQGVLLPPDETATLISQVDVPIASRKTFLSFDYTNTFPMYQSQTKDELEMIEWPNNHKGKGSAVSARPGLIATVFSNAKNKPLAIDFLNWISNDIEAGKILKTVRGVLPSSRQIEAVLADPGSLSAVDRKIFALTNKIYAGNINPFSPGIPGMNVIWDDTHIRKAGAEVAFGRITPEEAGRQFDEFVKDILSQQR
jgi:multiple sugar transport system substrate-binding protein